MDQMDEVTGKLQKEVIDTTYKVNSGKLVLEEAVQSELLNDMSLIEKEIGGASSVLKDIKRVT